MALFAKNLSGVPLTLAAGNPAPVLTTTDPTIEHNVTSELQGLTNLEYAALQVQVDAGDLSLEWSDQAEYATVGLTIPLYHNIHEVSGLSVHGHQIVGTNTAHRSKTNFQNRHSWLKDNEASDLVDLRIAAEPVNVPVTICVDPAGSDAPTPTIGRVGGPGANPVTVGAPSSSIQTLTFSSAHGLPATSAMVGFRIRLWGASNSGNNGSFEIVDAPSTTSLRITNSSGASEVTQLSWALSGGQLNTAPMNLRTLMREGIPSCMELVTYKFEPGIYDTPADITRWTLPSQVGFGDAIYIQGAVYPGVVSVDTGTKTIVLRGPLPECCLAGAAGTGATVSAASNGLATIDGLSSMSADYVGRFISLSGGLSDNNGVFEIATYVSATSVKVKNPKASVDATSQTWTTAGTFTIAGTGTAADGNYTAATISSDRQTITVYETPGAAITAPIAAPWYVVGSSAYVEKTLAASSTSTQLELADATGTALNCFDNHYVRVMAGARTGDRRMVQRSVGKFIDPNEALGGAPGAVAVRFERPASVIRITSGGLSLVSPGRGRLGIRDLEFRSTGTAGALQFANIDVQAEGLLIDQTSDTTPTSKGGFTQIDSAINSCQGTTFFASLPTQANPFSAQRSGAGIIYKSGNSPFSSGVVTRMGAFPLSPVRLSSHEGNMDTFGMDASLGPSLWQDSGITAQHGRITAPNLATSEFENAFVRFGAGAAASTFNNSRLYGCSGLQALSNTTVPLNRGTPLLIADVGSPSSVVFGTAVSGGVNAPAAQGTSMTIAAASPAQSGVWTLTGLASLTSRMVGRFISITGASNAGNNGVWEIVEFISATSCKIVNAAGVAEGPTAAIAWAVSGTDYANAGWGTIIGPNGTARISRTTAPTLTGQYGDLLLNGVISAGGISTSGAIVGVPYRWADAAVATSFSLGSGNGQVTYTPKCDRVEVIQAHPYRTSASLTVEVQNYGSPTPRIIVTLATDGSAAITSTAAQVAAAVNTDAKAKDLVSAVYGGTGASATVASSATLSGAGALSTGQVVYELRGNGHVPVFHSICSRSRTRIIASGSSRQVIRFGGRKSAWSGSGADTAIEMRLGDGRLLTESTDWENKFNVTSIVGQVINLSGSTVPQYSSTNFAIVAGDKVQLRNTTGSDGLYTVTSVTTNSITVSETIVAQGGAAGTCETLDAANVINNSTTQNQPIICEIDTQLVVQLVAGALCVQLAGKRGVATSTAADIVTAVNANESSGAAATISAVGGLGNDGVSDVATLTGLSAMTSAMVGRSLTISGAAQAANNGTFEIVAFVSATSVKIRNAAAVGGDANNGAISWSVKKDVGALVSATSSGGGATASRPGSASCYSMLNKLGGLATVGGAMVN